mmetsp:Transcript_19571/g.60351  ORF Transcript_19571/g.60351 Transcript_19571/m.60351 type:complete len:111 (+) Transcript_19571:267-599(+)
MSCSFAALDDQGRDAKSRARTQHPEDTTRFFEARPSTLHFSGFEVGRRISKKVQILNVSTTAQRLHVEGPKNPQFRIRRFVKKGRVAPGMVSLVAEFMLEGGCVGRDVTY